MNQQEMTDDERDYIENRDRDINVDITRIKRDIAETAHRHGFDRLTFTVEPGTLSYEPRILPVVSVEGTLLA